MKRIFCKLSDDHLHKLNTAIIYDNKTVLHLYNSCSQNKSPDNKQPHPTLKGNKTKQKSFSLCSRQRRAIIFTNWTYFMLVCIVWVCFFYCYFNLNFGTLLYNAFSGIIMFINFVSVVRRASCNNKLNNEQKHLWCSLENTPIIFKRLNII